MCGLIDAYDTINVKTKDALDAAQQRLGDSGFNLTFSLPTIQLNSEQIKLDDILHSAYKPESISETRWRRQSGVWGGICRLLDTDDMGWETYENIETHYVVNVDKIHQDINEKLKGISQQVDVSFTNYLTEKYQPEIDKYLAGLVTYLEGYKGVLIDGEQSQKNLEKDKAEVLKAHLKTLKNQVAIQNKDLKVINKALQEASPNAN